MRRVDPAYAVLGFVLVIWVGTALTVHPPSPPDAPRPGRFDAGRALGHVARIAAEPHPAGSQRNAAVREYLVEELRALGLEPVVREARVPASPYLREFPWLAPEAPARERDERGRPLVPIANVLARIPGTAGAGAVLLQAHYDSHPVAPGAADDAAGVAAVLEALRLLLPDAPYRNDLIVHFDDGEELGLLGARWFAEHDPWMADVRCVLNLDARGNAGAPICFQVGPASAPLVRALAASHPRPVAASLAAAVYERMPNDTSFTPFLRRGLPGLNFAFVGGASAYHRPWDTPENLSRGTLQRLGETTHALTRAVLELELDTLHGDAVFFNVGSGRLVVYPLAWTYPLLAPPLALLALVVWRARKTGARLLAGLGLALGLAVAVLVAGVAAWWAAHGLAGLAPFDGPQRGNLLSATLGGFGAFGAGLAAALAVLGAIERRRATDELAVGGALVWAGLLVAVTLWLPAAAYVFGWPLLFALPPLCGTARLARIGSLASYVIAATILAPTFYLLVQVRSIHPPDAGVVAAALAALGVLLYVPVLRLCLPRAGNGTAVLVGVLSAAALLAGAVAERSGV